MRREVKSFLDDPETPDWFRRTLEREAEQPGGTYDTGPGFERLMAAINAPVGGGSGSSQGPGGASSATEPATGGEESGGGVGSPHVSGPIAPGNGVLAAGVSNGAKLLCGLTLLAVGGAIVAYLAFGKADPPLQVTVAPMSTTRVDEQPEPLSVPSVGTAPLPIAPMIASSTPTGPVVPSRPAPSRVTVSTSTVSASAPSPFACQGGAGAPDEARCLEEVRKLMTSDPAGALRILQVLDASMSKGLLREERDRYRVLALVALGRTKEARELLVAFKQRHRESPYVKELEDALRPAATPPRDDHRLQEDL